MLSAAELHRVVHAQTREVRLARLQAVHDLVLKRLNNLLAHHLKAFGARGSFGRHPMRVLGHEGTALIRDHKMGVLRRIYSSPLLKALIRPIRTICIYKPPGR
jgi:hypothetical protein